MIGAPVNEPLARAWVPARRAVPGSNPSDLRSALGRSSAIWIVAIGLISATVAMFTFVQASRGFDSFIAQTTARKTAREMLVSTLDEQAALQRSR